MCFFVMKYSNLIKSALIKNFFTSNPFLDITLPDVSSSSSSEDESSSLPVLAAEGFVAASAVGAASVENKDKVYISNEIIMVNASTI